MTSRERIEALQALRAKATAGKWRFVPADNVFVTTASGKAIDFYPCSHTDISIERRNDNGEFIAACGSGVEQILRDALRWREALETIAVDNISPARRLQDKARKALEGDG